MLSLKEFGLNSIVSIDLEVATFCNLKCPTCRVTQSNKKHELMNFNNFIEIAHALKPAIQTSRVFNLSPSESLLHPRTFDMIDYIKGLNPNIGFNIITNGMLLDKDRQNELLKRDIKGICVSLDGATKETFESIRVGSNFELIKQNVKSFISKGGNVRTIFVSRKNNINELLPFVNMCSELGVSKIKVTGFNAYLKEHLPLTLYSKEGRPEVDLIYKEAQKLANEKRIDFYYVSTKLNESKCCPNWNTMFVDMYGNVSPCCFLNESSPLTLEEEIRTKPIIWGNVLKDNPLYIWWSDPSLQFRRDLLYGKECKFCAMKYGVICDMHKDSI